MVTTRNNMGAGASTVGQFSLARLLIGLACLAVVFALSRLWFESGGLTGGIIALLMFGCLMFGVWEILLGKKWLGGLALVAALVASCIDAVPPHALTTIRMLKLKTLIEDHSRTGHAIPENLTSVKFTDGSRPTVTDAWGRTMELVERNGNVTLTSFGADGKPGGHGASEDLSLTFALETK